MSLSGFCSLGHDGFLNVYCWEHSIQEYALLSRMSTLPIKTPLRVRLVGHGENLSVYVEGFQASKFHVWDIRRGYEVMRVEAGGWKRPHNCALIFTPSPLSDSDIGTTASSRMARTVFVCSVPESHNTLVYLIDNFHFRPNHPQALPATHLYTYSNGKVTYCADIVTVPLSNAQVKSRYCGESGASAENLLSLVFTGGEEGNVKCFAVTGENHLSFQHQVDFPAHVPVRALRVCVRSGDSSGVVVAAGGRLKFSVWHFDASCFRVVSAEAGSGLSSGPATTRSEVFSTHPLNCVLKETFSGTVWPQATQDHRILALACIALSASPSYPPISVYPVSRNESRISVGEEKKESNPFIMALCDSRGFINVVLLDGEDYFQEYFRQCDSQESEVFASSAKLPSGTSRTGVSAGAEDVGINVAPEMLCNSTDSSSTRNSKNGKLQILQEFVASECPIISCEMLRLTYHSALSESDTLGKSMSTTTSVNAAVACVGDTSGAVGLWMLAGSILMDGFILQKSSRLLSYGAHSMGANCIAVKFRNGSFPVHTVGSDSSKSSISWEILICSGGDDQSITVCLCNVTLLTGETSGGLHASAKQKLHLNEVLKKITISTTPQLQACVLSAGHWDSAAGSAVTGIKFTSCTSQVGESETEGEGGGDVLGEILVLSYDQRLYRWKVASKYNEESNLEVMSLIWLEGAMVNIGDLQTLSVTTPLSTDKNCKPIPTYAVVSGEGLQIFAL